MAMIFLNEPEDMEWLADVHCPIIREAGFKSAVLFGNEDAPHSVELYFAAEPRFMDKPDHVITFLLNPPSIL